jgi:hypothetical protein
MNLSTLDFVFFAHIREQISGTVMEICLQYCLIDLGDGDVIEQVILTLKHHQRLVMRTA